MRSFSARASPPPESCGQENTGRLKPRPPGGTPLKAQDTYRNVVSAPLAGRLARIALKEGDAVTVNTPLALLSSVLPAMLDERTLRELQARVNAAQDNVLRAGARIARAQVSLDQAKIEVRRSEQLAEQGFIAPIKVETERLATLGAQREVEAATEEQRVRVLIDITSPHPEWQALGDGYRVSVRIVTLAESNAVQVPTSAVFPLPGARGAGRTQRQHSLDPQRPGAGPAGDRLPAGNSTRRRAGCSAQSLSAKRQKDVRTAPEAGRRPSNREARRLIRAFLIRALWQPSTRRHAGCRRAHTPSRCRQA